MKTFEVVDKSSGLTVFTYNDEQPVEWDGYPFSSFDHNEVIVPPPPPLFGARRQLTKGEFRKLFSADELEAIDEFEINFEQMSLPVDVKRRIRTGLKDYYAAGYVDLSDDRVAMLLGVFAALGLIEATRIPEIVDAN